MRRGVGLVSTADVGKLRLQVVPEGHCEVHGWPQSSARVGGKLHRLGII